MPADILFNGIGLIGVVLCLAGFLLLQMGKLTGQQLTYIWLNLLGSSGILISLLHDWNLASFFIEAAWLLISLYGLIRYTITKKHGR